jgi:phosphate transport system ATP-binding protein
MESPILRSNNFNAFFGNNHVVKDVTMDIPRNNIVAVMGPSGCGKTTFLRCINRMHELIAGAKTTGEILINDEKIYDMHAILVRQKIGMVFNAQIRFQT